MIAKAWLRWLRGSKVHLDFVRDGFISILDFNVFH